MLKQIIEKYKNSDTILKASLWFAAVTILNKGVALLTQPIINRILTVEEVGIVSVYTTWSSIFTILATFNLFCGVLEVQLTKNKEDSKQVVSSLSFLSLIISIAFFGIIALFITPVSNFLELKPIYILIMAITIVSQAFFQFWCVPKRFEYAYKSYSVVVILVFFFQSFLTVLLSWIIKDDRVLGRILGLCIPELLVAVIILLKIIRNTSFSKITKYWKYGITFNIPLIPHYLSSLILASSDKIMIQKMTNEVAVGMYSVAYSYANLGLIVFTAVNNAYTPFAFQAIKDKNYKPLKEKTNWLVFLSVLTASIMSLLAPEALYILGGENYLDVLPIIPSLIFGVFLSSFYYIFSNVEFVYEKTKSIFPITLLGSIMNVGLNFIFIPIFGYIAASYTTVIGYLVIAICHYLASRKIVNKNIYDIKKISLYLLFLIIVCAMSLLLYKSLLLRYGVIISLLILMIITLLKKQKRKGM